LFDDKKILKMPLLDFRAPTPSQAYNAARQLVVSPQRGMNEAIMVLLSFIAG